jgi:glycosyltransferase involved in cell wall biosynthesis
MAGETAAPLRILHVLRAPVGGLFRHVVDLASSQAARGHAVGIVADATTGGEQADAVLAALAPRLALGVTRVRMGREIGFGDVIAIRCVGRVIADRRPNVVHGHGAKGGAYVRLAAHPPTLRVYTPHGGSLHYRWASPSGLLYLSLERALMGRTDLFLFESHFGRDAYLAKVGTPTVPIRVVPNGLAATEFIVIEPAPDAADLVFVGELRSLKGIDVLIDALARLAARGRTLTATIVGDGPERAAMLARSHALGLDHAVRFVGVMPARTAFARGRLLVVPSRAESLPYVVLEAAAAGVPMVATCVGGIPEIFAEEAQRLVAPGDPEELARAIELTLADLPAARAAACRLRERVRRDFAVETMTEAVLAGYRDASIYRHG